jgi:hypothetical protein
VTLGLDHNFVYAEPAGGEGNFFEADFTFRVPQQYITYVLSYLLFGAYILCNSNQLIIHYL